MDHSAIIRVAAIDPGTTNIAAWVGTYDPDNSKVETLTMFSGVPPECGDDMDKMTKKPSVQAISAECAMYVADICRGCGTDAVVVETAPQWNTPARLSAATVFGVMKGKGLDNVKFSAPTTKAKAISAFAEKLGMNDQLEKPPEGADKLDKKTSAKIRLMNKRNAVRVVERLLEESADIEGKKAFNSKEKRDDMADSLLLACGLAMSIHSERLKQSKKRKKTTAQDKTKLQNDQY